ncbi:phage tail protein [Oxalobacter formigenes]
MTKLPSKELLDGTKDPETTTGEFRTAMGQMRDYLGGLLGENSADKEAARAALGAVSPDDVRQMRYICGHATGTGDAFFAVFDPPVEQLTDATTVTIRAIGRNETATPTFKADETSELVIVKGTSMPLDCGDINGNGHWIDLRYDETLNKWVLLNPATGIFVSGVPSTQAGGTANAIVGCFNPAIIELKNGLKVSVRATAANTSAEPYFQLEDFAGYPIVKGINQPLIAGDIAGEGHWLDLQFDEEALIWILQNPASGVVCPSGVPVGAIGYFAMQTPPAGYLKADGSAVSRATYPDLFGAIGTTFGEGDGSTTFNLPDLIDRFAQGNATPGLKIEAGLPNITGSLTVTASNQGSAASGAFSRTQIGAVGGGLGGGQYNSSGCGPNLYSFDSRVSNPIYGASNTVQPPALTLLPCIKAFDAYPAVQAGISAMNAIGAPTRAARATVEPHASKAWVNFDASSGEITIRNAHHVDKVIRVEKGAFDIIFDGSVQADCCTVTVSSSALVSAVNLDSFTGDYFPPSANRVRVVTASGFPIQPVDPADINVVVNQ